MNRHFAKPLLALHLVPALLLLFASATPPQAGQAAVLAGDYTWTHDPSRIVKCNGKYFLYLTGDNIPMKYSTDLLTWKKGPNVLAHVPEWAHKAVPAAKGDNAWAPDVILVGDKYLLFWSYSTFGSRTSVTGLLTSPSLDPESPSYKWTDAGQVLATTRASDFNAIDPGPILDERGDLWLSIGSWQHGGIKIVKLDKATGKATTAPVSVAAGQGSGPEAPYLHLRDGWYYLFENEGTCCAGMNSTYNIRVGRSKTIAGPYLDKDGRDMVQGGGTLFMGTDGEAIGPGHVGIYSEDGIDRLSFHYYSSRLNGVPTLGLETLVWGQEGWPRVGSEVVGGRYAIVSQASGLALGIAGSKPDEGNPIDQFEYRGGPTQQWNISPTGDGSYAIGSMGTGKYLDLFQCGTADGTKISQYPWLGNDCQKWRIEPVSDGSYRILSKAGLALTMPGSTKEPLAQVQGWQWKAQSGQKWTLKKLP